MQYGYCRINISMWQENRDAPVFLSHGTGQSNVSNVKNWDTRRSRAQIHKSVRDVQKKGTTTANVAQQYQSVSLVGDHMNRSAGAAKCFIPLVMNRTLQILQLNVRKQQSVQHSLMNDTQLRDFGVLAISEPYARVIDGRVTTVPMGHTNWTKMVPSVQCQERWAFRSMLWVRKDIEAEQIPVQSSDLTAAVLRLPGRSILAVSVYVAGQDEEALLDSTNKLNQLIQETRNRIGTRVDVILAGDFNRHDQLWGGDDVSQERQGEADPIIDLMSEHALHSLLPRGTKTWQKGDSETTIDLVLASEELAGSVIKCAIHMTDEDCHIASACPGGWQRTAADRPVDDSRARSSLCTYPKSSALIICEEMVDERPDTTSASVHVLEESGASAAAEEPHVT